MDLVRKAKQLPESPGIYMMLDKQRRIIYVGKSKNLKNRVLSYFQASQGHSKKIKKLISFIHDFNVISLDTDFEALLLENEYIKKYQPLFNTLLKNPQTYCYIALDKGKRYPSFTIQTEMNQSNILYFGPFSNRKVIEIALIGLKTHFQMDCCGTCSTKKACFNTSIGHCMGICHDDSLQVQYNLALTRITSFLNHQNRQLIASLREEMDLAAQHLDYEKAQRYRDFIEAITILDKKIALLQFMRNNETYFIVEPLNHTYIKIFLIKGIAVLYSKKIEFQAYNLTQLSSYLFHEILRLHIVDTSPVTIQKQDLDAAAIMYSFWKRASYLARVNIEDKPNFRSVISDLIGKAIHQKLTNIKWED